jgi:hypothetical protein
VNDVMFSVIAAPLDDRLTAHERAVMAAVGAFPHIVSLDEVIRAGDLSLDELCRRLPRTPRPYVFYAVARLEDLGYLPKGAIR